MIRRIIRWLTHVILLQVSHRSISYGFGTICIIMGKLEWMDCSSNWGRASGTWGAATTRGRVSLAAKARLKLTLSPPYHLQCNWTQFVNCYQEICGISSMPQILAQTGQHYVQCKNGHQISLFLLNKHRHFSKDCLFRQVIYSCGGRHWMQCKPA